MFTTCYVDMDAHDDFQFVSIRVHSWFMYSWRIDSLIFTKTMRDFPIALRATPNLSLGFSLYLFVKKLCALFLRCRESTARRQQPFAERRWQEITR